MDGKENVQNEKGMTFGTFIGMAGIFSAPLRGLVSKPNTMGRRLIRHPLTVLAFLPPLVWASATGSPCMWAVVGLSVLGFLLQVRSKGHSFDIGEPRFGAKLDTLILAAAGLGLYFLDQHAGDYLVLVAVADMAVKWWVSHRMQMQDDDVTDGMIEARSRAHRVRNRG